MQVRTFFGATPEFIREFKEALEGADPKVSYSSAIRSAIKASYFPGSEVFE